MAAQSDRHTVSATEARLHFGEMLKRAALTEEPIVVILSLAHHEQLHRDARVARFERLSRIAGLEAESQGLTEERLEHEMETIRQRDSQATYG